MIYAALQEYWPNATDNNPLPGGAEYNHIGPNSMGPLKTNRTVPCPYESLSIEEQEEQCYSYQEFVYVVRTLIPMLIHTLRPTLKPMLKHRTSDVPISFAFSVTMIISFWISIDGEPRVLHVWSRSRRRWIPRTFSTAVAVLAMIGIDRNYVQTVTALDCFFVLVHNPVET